MSNAWKVLACVCLVGFGIFLAVRIRTSQGFAPKPQPAPVDLTAFYDIGNSTFNAPGCWRAVPRGLETMGGVPFQIEGLIQLWGRGPAGMGRNYRERVEGLPVKGKFETLYILHGASFATADETPIAEVVFRYADGTSATNEIQFGTNVRDWWQPRKEQHPSANDPASQVVWRGTHPTLPGWVKSLRLFGTALPNPKPGNEVQSVDLLSTKSQVTWFVLAMTPGPAGLLKVDPKLDQDEIEEADTETGDSDAKQ